MLDITPKTKIAEIIQEYPELKEKIISLAPPFKKLQNPVLLKTVARVTSLNQAAKVGNIDLMEFVNILRIEVGQEPLKLDIVEQASDEPPFWFKTGTIQKTIDARPLLEQGEQPIGLVLEELAGMGDGEILEIITPFVPAPLSEKAEAKNYSSWTRQKGVEKYHTYFTRKSQ
jgi:hypothetical protein